MLPSKSTLPELEEILVPLQATLTEIEAKLRGLRDNLAPFQKYNESADVKLVSDEIASYSANLARILNGDMAFLRDRR
jgi:hypothetical protein